MGKYGHRMNNSSQGTPLFMSHTAMQFGQLLTHLDTTQQMINNSLKDNNTLLTQVRNIRRLQPTDIQLTVSYLKKVALPQIHPLLHLLTSGPADDEGKPSGHRGELCHTWPENEKGIQIKPHQQIQEVKKVWTWTWTNESSTLTLLTNTTLHPFRLPSFFLLLSSSTYAFFTEWNVGNDWK